MFRLFRFCICSLLLTPLAGWAADEDAWLVLEKASQAAHKLSYKGIYVYQAGRAISNMQIMHMNYAHGEFARVISLDGAPREMLRQGNEAVIYSAQDENVLIEKRQVKNSFPALLPVLSEEIKASYQAKVMGQERVGGRDTLVVQLAPRDRLRYSYRFSVDREFGLLLKSLMLNEKNEVVEQVAFSQLTMMPTLAMDWFRPNVERGKNYVMQSGMAAQQAKPEGGEVTVAQLPPGFVKVDQTMRAIPGKPLPVSQWVFSDGIASVSLFVEVLDKGSVPKSGHLLQGASNLYAKVVDGRQIIVVGEVPEAVVRQIGDSVSFKK